MEIFMFRYVASIPSQFVTGTINFMVSRVSVRAADTALNAAAAAVSTMDLGKTAKDIQKKAEKAKVIVQEKAAEKKEAITHSYDNFKKKSFSDNNTFSDHPTPQPSSPALVSLEELTEDSVLPEGVKEKKWTEKCMPNKCVII